MEKLKVNLPKDIKQNIDIVMQPFYSIKTKRYSNGEILVRGKDGKSASDVLKVICDRNKQAELDYFILNKVCKKLCKLNGRNGNTGKHLKEVEYHSDDDTIKYRVSESDTESLRHISKVNVNLSPVTLNTPKASTMILEILNNYNMKNKIVLEISEDSIIDSDACQENILDMLNNGVNLSLDDINFSSRWMSIASKYNLYELKYKLDTTGEIIGSIELAMLKHLNIFCTDIGIRLIIECVETPHQLYELSTIDIDTIQGYLVCKPKKIIE